VFVRPHPNRNRGLNGSTIRLQDTVGKGCRTGTCCLGGGAWYPLRVGSENVTL